MAILPTEADVGPLPSVGQQRQPVGSYDPSAIAAGARQLGQGVENLGQGLTVYGEDQSRKQDDAQVSLATSDKAVAAVKAREAAATATDPSQLDAIQQQYIDATNAGVGAIKTPQAQQRFVTTTAPAVAETIAMINSHRQRLGNQQMVAGIDQGGTDAINTGKTIDDSTPEGRANLTTLIMAQDNRYKQAVATGAMTPEAKQQAARNFGEQFYETRHNYLRAEAIRTNDPTKLQQLYDQIQQLSSSGSGAPTADQVHAAIVGQESGGNPNVGTSVDGARGIGQIEPATFAQYAKPGESIGNPADNLAVSKRIINDYYQRYGGDPSRVAVAYFSGPGNVAPAGSPTPWIKNAADGNGKTTASYVADVAKRIGVAPAAPAAKPFVIGDSLGDGLKTALGADGVTTVGRQPQDVLADINGLDPKQLAGKSIILSSGASNDPANGPGLVPQQIAALTAKGVDPANITVLGVGTRQDFQQNAVSAKLQAAARVAGAKFMPVDPASVGPDGVHPTTDGYKALAQGAVGQPGGAAPATGASNSPLALLPPQYVSRLQVALQNEIDGITRKQSASIQSDIQDDQASIMTTGVPLAGLTPEKVERAFGPDAADQFVRGRQFSQNYYNQTADMTAIPDAKIVGRLAALAPQPGSLDFIAQQKIYDRAKTQADAITKMRVEDPASSVDKLPDVQAARQGVDPNNPSTFAPLIKARLIAQTAIGIPADRQMPVTKEEARAIIAPIRDALPGTERAAMDRVVPVLDQTYGPMADRVLAFALRQEKIDSDTAAHATYLIRKLHARDPLTQSDAEGFMSAQTAGAMSAAAGQPAATTQLGPESEAADQSQPATPAAAALPAPTQPSNPAPFRWRGSGPMTIPRVATPPDPRRKYIAPPDDAIRALVGDPTKAPQFDTVFGKGSAAKVLRKIEEMTGATP